MKISGNNIKIGNVIEHKGRLWIAVKTMHTQPGKGGAYLQVELKGLKDGVKLNERFRSSEVVERVHMDEEEYQFLFSEGDSYTFMNTQSYEQIALNKELIGDSTDFLQEEMIVKIASYDGEILGVNLPDTVVMKIVDSEPVIKGQTASSSYKPAILENGRRIMVPPHVETGTRVVINTADGTYLEKAKD